MIKIKNTTLIGIDGRGTESSLMDKIISWCIKKLKFDHVIHLSGNSNFTSKNKQITTKNIVKLNSTIEYNKFCVHDLHNIIETDYCIIVHTDGFIINPHLWSDSFFDYDYVGAPWCPDGGVGNGGFSLRSKKFLEYSRLFEQYQGVPNEDYFLSIQNSEMREKMQIKIAPCEIAAKFSVETICDKFPNINNSFGFHGKSNISSAMVITSNLEQE